MKKTSALAFGGMTAALYAALTIIPALIPAVGTLLYGPIQFRLSEMLCVLPYFVPGSAWGLFAGCVVANAIGTAFGLTMPIDIVVGSLTTLAAALITTKIKIKWLVPLPAVVLNAVIVGGMLAYLFPIEALPFWKTFAIFGFQVGLGQTVVCYGLGLPLLHILEKRKDIFRSGSDPSETDDIS